MTHKIAVIKTWSRSPARHVVGGIRYTNATGAGEWVEIPPDATIGDGVTIGNYAKIGDGAKIGHYAKIGNYVKIGDGAKIDSVATIGDGVTIGHYAMIGNYATIGEGAKIGCDAKIGHHATIGNYAMIGEGAKIDSAATIGHHATISDGAKINESPLYLCPRGGHWPVYVSDPDKRLVGVGCEIHTIDFWLGEDGVEKVREKHDAQDTTAATYALALRYVAQAMGWLSTMRLEVRKEAKHEHQRA